MVEWLGQQTTIGGELYRTPDGLSLIARTGTATATPQTGADERALDAMIQAAAEQVYAATQPYRYAVYLGRRGDEEGNRRSEAALRALTRSSDRADQMWGFTALNLQLQQKGDLTGAIEAANAALAIEPKFNLAYANRGGARTGLGHAEAAHQDNLMAYRTLRSDGRRFMKEEGLAFSTFNYLAITRADLGDYAGTIEPTTRGLTLRPDDAGLISLLGSSRAAMYEVTAARAEFNRFPPMPADADAAIQAQYAETDAQIAALLAVSMEDWDEVVRQIDRLDLSGRTPAQQARDRIFLYPGLALALALSRDTARAKTVIAQTPTDCYYCVITRGLVAEASGDRAGADRWFVEAIRQGPSLPFALQERGRARLARGDLTGAVADFRESARRGPGWADPLKYWGDALTLQGDPAGAVRKYRTAAERAPRWGALHLAWGRALAAQGQTAAAREKYRRASRLDLSAADRAAVTRLLAART